MKKLIVLLAAIVFVVPLIGCGGSAEDEGPVTMPDGSNPDANFKGDNTKAGGAAATEPQ